MLRNIRTWLHNHKVISVSIMSVVILAEIIVLLLLTVFSGPKALTVGDYLELGEKYLLEMNYEQALVQFLAVIDIEPRNPRGYTGAADAYIGLDDADSAVRILEQGLEQLPHSVFISTMLEDVQRQKSVNSGATITLTRAAEDVRPLSDEEMYAEVFEEFRNRDLTVVFHEHTTFTDMYYAFYDIDSNGVKEIVFCNDIRDDVAFYRSGAVIYTFSNGKGVEIFYSGSHPYYFNGINEAGYIISGGDGSGWAIYKYTKILPDGVSTETISIGEGRDAGGVDFAFNQDFLLTEAMTAPFVELDWKPLTETTGMTTETQQSVAANPVLSEITIENKSEEIEQYRINGAGYIKLRDVAMLLSGTDKQFSINETEDEITLNLGEPYITVGGEMTTNGQTQSAIPINWQTQVNGVDLIVTAYKIEESLYFSVEDLAVLLYLDIGIRESMQESKDWIQIYRLH